MTVNPHHKFRRLLDVDLYSFDFRLGHIAKHVQLPPLPALGDQSHVPREQRLPPLLIVNIQLPEYPVRFHSFGTHTNSRIFTFFTFQNGRRVRCSSLTVSSRITR